MAEDTNIQTPLIIPGEFIFDGVLYIPPLSKERIQGMCDWPVHEDDVFITGYPKSGNNWVYTIVSALLQANKLRTFEKNGMKDKLTAPIEIFSLGHVHRNIPRPSVFYTHLLPSYLPHPVRAGRIKVIHVLRNPRDIAVSYYHLYRMNEALGCYKGSWDDFYHYFYKGHVFYGEWHRYVEEWMKASRDMNVKHVHYEDIIDDPEYSVKSLADFLQVPVTPEQINDIVRLTSFPQMKANSHLNKDDLPLHRTEISHFIRKGIVGDWKNYFTDDQKKLADAKYQELVEKTGLSFRFE